LFRDEGEAGDAGGCHHDAFGRGADFARRRVRCQQILALWMAALYRHDATAMDAFMRFPHVRLAAGKVTVHDAPGGLVIDVTLGEGLIRRVEVNLHVLETKSRIERIVETIQLSPTCHSTCSFIELRSLESCRCASLESFAGNVNFCVY
jgi:hypothetical protein